MPFPMRVFEKLDDWHLWRSNGVGSSDASTILGVNPYQSLEKLFWEKVYSRTLSQDNVVTRHGRHLEPLVRNFFNHKNNCNTRPLYGENCNYDFLRASFDGVDEEKNILLEIKCPVYPYKGIPLYYYVQVQHQMLVSGGEEVVFLVYCRNKLYTHRVPRDDRLISVLFERELEFWQRVVEHRKLLCPQE